MLAVEAVAKIHAEVAIMSPGGARSSGLRIWGMHSTLDELSPPNFDWFKG